MKGSATEGVRLSSSRETFFKYVNTYRELHENNSDPRVIERIAQAILYVGDGYNRHGRPRQNQAIADSYIRGVRKNAESWAAAKNMLESLVENLTANNPSMVILFDQQRLTSLPEEVAVEYVKLRATGAAVYRRLDMPFKETAEFSCIRDGAVALLDRYREELEAKARLHSAIEERKFSANLESALEIIAEGAKDPFSKNPATLEGVQKLAPPIQATLYLLSYARGQDRSKVIAIIQQWHDQIMKWSYKRARKKRQLGRDEVHLTLLYYAQRLDQNILNALKKG